MAVDRAQTIMARSDVLAQFSEEDGKLTRRYGSTALKSAQESVAGWMRDAGMTVRRDAIGNLIGRYEAGNDNGAARKCLLLGGHLDTVRDAGKYDGTLGVLIGIACVEGINRSGRDLPFDVDVVAFADEEGLRFHTTYLASLGFAGLLDPSWLEWRDPDGMSVAEVMRGFGGDPDALLNGGEFRDQYLGFIETHIEQGPVLEAEGIPVGVVSSIAGQMRTGMAFTGVAGHAGTVPMSLRRDALCAAAEFVLKVESVGRETDGLVATVGQLTAEPGASNVVPGRVALTLDVRHADDVIRNRAVEVIMAAAEMIAAHRGVQVDYFGQAHNKAMSCDPRLMGHIESALQETGLPVRRLVSGAGHDAVALSARMPVSMLFVRCAGGVSHNPAESIDVGDVAVAIEVIDRTIERLASA